MAESSLFQPMFPNQPIDVMLLVENSEKMSFIWNDLRDRYLSCLMERLEVANDTLPAPTTVWVLESQPSQTGSTALPRQYMNPRAALDDVRINYLPENRLSYNKVDEAVNFLSSLRGSGEARALHLIVVAASSPAACIDVTGREIITDPSGFSPWYNLAHKLAQASIFCHILIRSTSEDMTALTALFDETLRSQSNIEDLVTFPPDSEFAVRLSMSPRKQGQFNPPPRPQRIPMPPRRNTFPLEPGYLHQYEDPYSPTRPVDMEGSPSIVSHLQQVHGLTKKKVYGAKPARQPFVRDEAPAYAAGPPLAGPAYSHDGTLPPSSGRAMTHSKADRLARLAQASPTAADSQGRYLPVAWARRGSCISSPDEVDGIISPTSVVSFADISPPTSYMSSNMSSPISPASVDDYYGLPTAASSMPPPSAVNGGGPDPTWLQSPYAASYSQASMATVPAHYYISGPVPPTYHDGGMYIGHDYSMPPQLPPSGIPPKGLALPPMVIGTVNKQPPPKSSSIEIPPPPGAEISAAPSSHHHHHASSERRTGSSTSKAATSNANGGSTSSASASSSSTGALPPPPPVPATTPSSSKTTAVTTSSSLPTKKARPPRPEDDEYIELTQQYVKETTDLFNAFFPNTKNFPDSIVSTSSGTNTSLSSTSTPTSTSSSTISSSSTPPTTSPSATNTSTGAATGATITSSSTPSSSSSTGLTAVATPPGSGSSNSTSATPPGTASPGGRNGSSTKSKSSKTGPGSPSTKLKGKKGGTAGGGIQKRRGTASSGSGSKVGGNSSNGNGSSNHGRGLTGSPIPGPSTSPSLRSPKVSNPSSTSTTTNASSASTGSGSVGSITSGIVGMVASGPSSSDTHGIVPPPGSSFASAGIGTSVGVEVPAGGMLYGGSSAKPQGIIPSASLPTREPLSGGLVGDGGGLQILPPLSLAAYPASAGAAANGYFQRHQVPPPLPLPTSLSAPPGSSYQPQYLPPMGGEYHRYQQQQQLHLPPGPPPSAIPHQLSNANAASGTEMDPTTSMALQQHHMHLASISAGSAVGGAPPSYYAPPGYQYAHLAPAASGAPGPTSSLTGWAG